MSGFRNPLVYSLSLILLLSSHFLFGQLKTIVKVQNHLRQGEHLEALDLINEATEHAETMNRADTWYYRGLTFEGIYSERTKVGYDKVSNPLFEAAHSYKKALGLESGNIGGHDVAGRYQILSNTIFQEGVNLYDQKAFLSSAHYFEYCEEIKATNGEIDSLAIYNQALAYENARMYTEAVSAYQRCADITYRPEFSYLSIASIYNRLEDDQKALEVIKKARALYPNHIDLLTNEINLFLKYGKYEEALENLDLVIENGGANQFIYFARGTIYNNQQEIEKAESDYLMALQIDSLYFDALYNLGALYFNYGADIFNKASELTDDTAYQKVKKEAETQFNKAVPFLEKANAVKPTDKSTIQSLMQLYLRTKQESKYLEMKKKLEGN